MDVICWSGGHDSTIMLHYLLNNQQYFAEAGARGGLKIVFVDSSIIFPETLKYLETILDLWRIRKFFVCLKPKVTFFEYLEKYRFFPSIRALWCREILKIDPLKKFYNSVEEPITEYIGTSKHDSNVRKRLYANPPSTRKWGKKVVSCEYPLLDWDDEKKSEYMREHRILPNPVYSTVGLSGCWFCPFYHEKDYLRLRRFHPDLFNKIVECEEKFGKRALPDFWIRDLVKT